MSDIHSEQSALSEEEIYEIYGLSSSVAGVEQRSEFSFEFTSDSDDESTSSRTVVDVFAPQNAGTVEDDALLQGDDIGAGDFMAYKSSKNVEVTNRPQLSVSTSKPVKRFGDIMKTRSKRKEKTNTPVHSKSKPSEKTEAVIERNASKSLNVTKSVVEKRHKTAKKKKAAIPIPKPSEPKPTAKVKDDMKFEKDDSGKYKCPQCPRVFKRNNRVKVHLRIHENKASKKCKICDIVYIKYHTCKKNDSGYECSVCSKTFALKASLTIHEKTHTTDRNFVCNVCYKSFHVISSLTSHLATHKEKRYQCSCCDKCFTTKSLLRVHCRTHSQEKPYECKHCGKKFTQRSNMNTHERIHTKAHPYMCEMCDKSFAHKSTYNSHLRTHTKVKPYSCELCQKSFSQRGSLYNHMNTHKEPKFSCSYCGAKLAHPQTLWYHENNHVKQGHQKLLLFGSATT